MFLYEKKCPVSLQLRNFATMNNIAAYISIHAAKLIIGMVIVIAFACLYWMIWRTLKEEEDEKWHT